MHPSSECTASLPAYIQTPPNHDHASSDSHPIYRSPTTTSQGCLRASSNEGVGDPAVASARHFRYRDEVRGGSHGADGGIHAFGSVRMSTVAILMPWGVGLSAYVGEPWFRGPMGGGVGGKGLLEVQLGDRVVGTYSTWDGIICGAVVLMAEMKAGVDAIW